MFPKQVIIRAKELNTNVRLVYYKFMISNLIWAPNLTHQFFCILLLGLSLISNLLHAPWAPSLISILIILSKWSIYISHIQEKREVIFQEFPILSAFISTLRLDSFRTLPSNDTKVVFRLLSRTNPSSCLPLPLSLVSPGIPFHQSFPLSYSSSPTAIHYFIFYSQVIWRASRFLSTPYSFILLYLWTNSSL